MVNSKETKYWNSFSNLVLIYINISLIFVTWDIYYSDKVFIFKILIIIMILVVLFSININIYYARKNYSKKEDLQSSPSYNSEDYVGKKII